MLFYCFSNGAGFVKIKSQHNASYCLHIYINSEKVLDTRYQKSNVFLLNLKEVISAFSLGVLKIRYFVRVGDQRNISTEKIGLIDNENFNHTNIGYDVKDLTPDEMLCFLNYSLNNSKNTDQGVYELLCKLDSHNLFLIKDEIEKVIINFNENDKNFLLGVLHYRITDFDKAKLYFSKTKDKENSFDKIGKAVFLYNNSVISTRKFDNKFTILISCDVGYLYAYKDNLIESLRYHDLPIHVHVLVCKQSSIDKISDDFKKYKERLNLSFEVLTNQDKKTYSSISRFIKAKEIIEQYSTPVLVADIDLDFSKDSIKSLRKLNLSKIGFYINEDQLPWKKILAGFCYFPDTKKSLFFLENLANFLLKVCEDGDYYWTLDQVALTNMYDSMIVDHSDFINFHNEKTIRLRQVENRQAARKFALQYKDY